MNEHRRIRGSLLERAAEVYDFGRPPVPVAKGMPVSAPPPVSAPVQAPAPPIAQGTPVVDAPVAVVSQPAPEPVVVAAPEPVAVPEPVEEPAPTARGRIRTGAEFANCAPAATPRRQMAAIDRGLLAEQGFLVPGAGVDALAEEFRMVKRQLLITARAVAGVDTSRARMILVTSAKPNEGKTFCAINLALSMAAEQDVEILLVDADFAKPDIMKRLGQDDATGLLDALADPSMDVESCVLRTDIPKLSLLPAGSKSARDTELLASDRARDMLARLATADARRIIIFDSPPVLAASPASVLALHVGQALMVVRADKTTEGDLREAVNLIGACEHIQLALNNVTFNPGGRRFGGYYDQESGK